MEFSQSDDPRIFRAPPGDDAHLHCAYILPSGSSLPQNSIDAAAAFSTGEGSFCFSTVPITADIFPEIDPLHAARGFGADGPQRFLVWHCETPSGTPAAKTVASFAADDSGTMRLTMPLVVVVEVGHLNAHIPQGSTLALADNSDSIVITPGSNTEIQVHGSSAFQINKPQPATIDFQGKTRGFPRFTMGVDLGDLLQQIPVGFRYTLPIEDSSGSTTPLFFSLFETPAAATWANMELVIDPFTADYDIEGLARSSLAFVGAAESPRPMASTYRSREGYPVHLQPATAADGVEPAAFRFASHGATGEFLYFDPSGDFWPSVDTPAESLCDLMCGLSATEIIRLQQRPAAGGDRLRFLPGMPANAPEFPLPPSSTVAAPRPAAQALLNSQSTASWVAAVPGSDPVQYAAQPGGNALYGKDAVVYANNDHWLGFVEPGVTLGSDPAPIVPYLGLRADTANVALADFENQLILPTRHRALLAKKTQTLQQIAHADTMPRASAAIRATTTRGLIVTIGADGRWSEVNLAVSDDGQVPLRFLDLSSELQQVFQAQQVFAVLVNPEPVGAPGESPGFDNSVNMDGWSLNIDIGEGGEYAHYSNVMVLKFCPGKLVDLAKNTSVWNNAAVLSVQDRQNPQEVTAVSQWLQDYIDTARQRQADGKKVDPDYPFYEHFLSLAEDENWTGVLALKVNIAAIPSELQGLLDGIDTTQFFAHHLGVDINPVEGTDIELKKDSSVFGLIDYANPLYRPEHPEQAVQPQSDGPFEFTVLTLQVLFENASVKAFNSKAQLGIAELFGATVDNIVDDQGNTASAVILDGRYQKSGDNPGFVMETQAPATVNMQSTVLPRTRISRVQFTTVEDRQADTDPGQRSHVRFNFHGTMDFLQIGATDTLPANDLFSFGSSDASDTSAGLAYSNLLLDLLAERDEQGAQQFVFSTADVRFNADLAAARHNSLYQAFPLSAGRLLGGPGAASPVSLGYLPVGGDSRLGDISGSWYGLSFRLDLGTPGELASHIGFEAELLLAWEPVQNDGEHLPAFVGLKLPGTEGVSALGLQGIVKVTIDDIELIPIADESQGTIYLLKLRDIALSLLGLKKIPSSSGTTFYLFASPDRSAGRPPLGWYAIYNPDPEKAADG